MVLALRIVKRIIYKFSVVFQIFYYLHEREHLDQCRDFIKESVVAFDLALRLQN